MRSIGHDLLRGSWVFETFRRTFGPLRDAAAIRSEPWLDTRLGTVDGFSEFVAEFAGATFAGGLYRVHDRRTGQQALGAAAEAFPEFTSRFHPFAYDWLGRQFGVDFGRMEEGRPLVLLLEPGTGEALEVPATFASFHEEELVNYADAALATTFFDAWAAVNRAAMPLKRDLCVGYRVPLFLGGRDEVDNMEISDFQVYWSICGQLRLGTLNLPPGTSVNQVGGP